MKQSKKMTKTLAEFESVIDVYERNGFKVQSKTNNEAKLMKKTRTKKWKTFNKSSLIIPKLVVMCCTLFTIVFIYNALHTKKEMIVVTLEA